MPKGQFLGELELYVIGALARLGDDAYGVTIRQEIESQCGRSVAIGSVYATLSRLFDKGYVTFHVSDVVAEISGDRPLARHDLDGVDRRALRRGRSNRRNRL